MVRINDLCSLAYVICIMLLCAIAFLWVCVDGLCTPEWLLTNVILSCIGEAILCYVLVRHIRRSVTELKGSRVRDFYERILLMSISGFLFGSLWMLDACGVITSASNNSISEFGFACNIMVIAVAFLVWMAIEIYKFNRHKKSWIKLLKKAIGIAITFFLKSDF